MAILDFSHWHTWQGQYSPSSTSSLHCGETSILFSSEHPMFNCLVFVFTLPPQFIVASRRLRDGSMMFAFAPKLSESESISTLSLLLLRLFRTNLMTSSSSMFKTSLPSSDTSLNAPPWTGIAIESRLSDSVDCSSSPLRNNNKERRCRNDLLRSLKCQLLSESSSFLKLNDVCALKLLFAILSSNDDKSWRWWWLLWSFELWFRLWRGVEVYGGLMSPLNV